MTYSLQKCQEKLPRLTFNVSFSTEPKVFATNVLSMSVIWFTYISKGIILQFLTNYQPTGFIYSPKPFLLAFGAWGVVILEMHLILYKVWKTLWTGWLHRNLHPVGIFHNCARQEVSLCSGLSNPLRRTKMKEKVSCTFGKEDNNTTSDIPQKSLFPCHQLIT